MIFPKIECDDIVQVSDKLRLDASKSYISKGEADITLVEIQPDTAEAFIEVSGVDLTYKDWYLDWEYATDGDKTISVRITTDGSPVTVTKTVTVVSLADDKLLSTDNDLVAIESDILKYVPDGRSTFNYVHREARNEILEWLYKTGFRKPDGSRYTIENIINIEDFKYWSKYLAFRLIYEDLSTQNDDVYATRSKQYENVEANWRHSSGIKLDTDSDGTQSTTEELDLVTRYFIRE